MFGKAGIAGLMKQAQQMQDNMKKAQEELAKVTVEGQAGAGMVTVIMACNYVVQRVIIDDSLVKEANEDKGMLEDLIAAAYNDAMRKVEVTSQQKMAAFTTGLNLPPGIKLPF